MILGAPNHQRRASQLTHNAAQIGMHLPAKIAGQQRRTPVRGENHMRQQTAECVRHSYAPPGLVALMDRLLPRLTPWATVWRPLRELTPFAARSVRMRSSSSDVDQAWSNLLISKEKFW